MASHGRIHSGSDPFMEEEGSEGGGREGGREREGGRQGEGGREAGRGREGGRDSEMTIPCSWQSRMTPSPSEHGFCSIELLELHMEQD